MKRGTTEFLFSLDNLSYGDGFLDMKVDDIKEKFFVYGFVQDIDSAFDKWEREWGVNSFEVKVGGFDSRSKKYDGMTVREAVNFRVQEQHSNSDLVEYIPVFCAVFEEDKEYEFRNFLRNKCTKYSSCGENVRGLTKSNIRQYYTWYRYGIRRAENYRMHKAQKKAVKKMVRAFNELKYTLFLLGAKPRFGKNHAILQCAKHLGFKNILFVSWLPTVFDSLENDVMNHIEFDGWKYINYRETKNRGVNPYDNETPTVVSVSAQLATRINDEDGPKSGFSIEEMNDFRESLKTIISSAKIDLLVIDEAHFGGHTDYTENIINTVSAKFTIFVTGTDSNFITDGRFTTENSFEYDYIDECLDDDEHAQKMPKIKIYTFEIDKAILKITKEYKMEEFPTFKKLFSVKNNGKFQYENLVEIFFKTIFGKRTIDDGGRAAIKINSISPFNNESIGDNINHSLAIMPSVKAVKAAIKLLNKMGLDNFEFIDAAGDGIKDIKEVKGKIQTNKHYAKKTVTFVCRRFREGVTVPDWNAVFLFDDGKSFNEYMQTAFRVQGFNENKPFCYIFDYNPERCLRIRYEHANYYCKRGYTKEQMESVLYDCMPIIYINADGNLVENGEFKDRLMEASHNNFTDGYGGMGMSLINECAVTSAKSTDIETFSKMFNEVNSVSNNVTTIKGQTNGTSGGKLREIVKRITEAYIAKKDNTVQKEYKKLMSLCAETTKHIPEFLFVCNKNYYGIIDALKEENSSIFYDITSVDMDDFKTILDSGFIRVDLLDYSIRKFYKDKEMYDLAVSSQSSINDHETILNIVNDFHNKWIYESDAETIDIPYSVTEVLFN